MDINGTPYFLLGSPDDFAHRSSFFLWDARRGAFTLRQSQELRLPRASAEQALSAWRGAPPLVRDPFGQIGRIGPPPDPPPDPPASPGGDRIELNAGSGFRTLVDEELQPVAAPAGRFLDLALGGDGRLVAAYSDGAARHGLVLFHLGSRWQTPLTPELSAAPVRAIVDRDDQVWCVTAETLILCRGEPLPHPYQPLPARFEPLTLNPHPFAPVWSQPLPDGLAPLALCADAGRLYLLVHAGAADADALGPQQILTRPRDRDPAAPWIVWPIGPDCPPVLDLGVLPDGRLAAPALREPADTAFLRRDCPVLELVADSNDRTRLARLAGERFPLRSQASPRLVSALDGRVRYQAEPDPGAPDRGPRALPLLPLPRPAFPAAAYVTPAFGAGGQGLDSGRPGTPWHRVYIDGCIPPGCRLTLMAKTFEDPGLRAATPFEVQPAPLWSPLGSELPFHTGLAPSKPGESGLFEVLLQHVSGAARTLRGRYLQLRIRMESDGRHTPAIHAMRVYAPRFSYQESYLPELFRQRACRDDPNSATGPANGADVRERLLAAFEGVVTPIEGRIAAAEALLHPDSAPTRTLPRLAGLLGLKLPLHWPEDRRRRLLADGCLLQQWRGTYPGLRLALDIATGGAVARGQVVVVENFRLRRTFATILGLDLDDRDHPLTLGTGMSGNSIVGDSLILSDEDTRTFLSLLAPELGADTGLTQEQLDALTPEHRSDAEVVRAFFDRYSHRVSVLLHGPARRERALVEEVLTEELPAHLEWRIVETDHPFVLGLAPLLEVDSFLEETPPPKRVALDDTYLGREGVLKNPLALLPRAVNASGSE